jgi:hypothetical protein
VGKGDVEEKWVGGGKRKRDWGGGAGRRDGGETIVNNKTTGTISHGNDFSLSNKGCFVS